MLCEVSWYLYFARYSRDTALCEKLEDFGWLPMRFQQVFSEFSRSYGRLRVSVVSVLYSVFTWAIEQWPICLCVSPCGGALLSPTRSPLHFFWCSRALCLILASIRLERFECYRVRLTQHVPLRLQRLEDICEVPVSGSKCDGGFGNLHHLRFSFCLFRGSYVGGLVYSQLLLLLRFFFVWW